MELTIDQALQRGIEAQKAGQVQEANRLYTSILRTQPKHPDANHNMGVLAVGIGKTQEALPFFKTALEANPNTAQFWLSFIDALIKLERLADAKAVLDQAKSNGANGEGFDSLEKRLLQNANAGSMTSQNSVLDKAIELRERGKFSQAIDLLKDEIIKHPKDANLLALLSHCYLLNKGIEEATIQLDKAKSIDLNNALVGWNEARLLLQNKSVSEALVVASNTNKRFPDDVEGLGVLGSCLRANNELLESLLYLDKAIELDPNYAEAFINRGLIRLSKEDKVEALEDLEAAHNLKPHIKQIWDLIISLKMGFGQFSETITLLELMTKTDPKNAKNFFNKAVCHQHLAEFKMAIEFYNKALSIEPDNAEVYVNMGSVLKDQGKLEEAIAACKKALSIKPDYAEVYNNMGSVLVQQGKLEEALQSYNKALTIKPDHFSTHNNKGIVLGKQGKMKGAVEAYKKALGIKPDSSEASFNMAVALFGMEQYEKAALLFKKNHSTTSQNFLLRCLYAENKQSPFYDQLDYLIDRGENNAVIGSHISRSNAKYQVTKPNPFCNNPLKYVMKTDLTERCNFKSTFVKSAVEILNDPAVKNMTQGLLTNGIQTSGNVFTQISSKSKKVEKIIRTEIENYRLKFNKSNEGLIMSWPTKYELFGWLVSMKNGGAIKPHMHEEGWLSGSIYINVPPKLNKDSGNLVVCLNDEPTKDENMKSIDVITGSLCLFPSSLHHFTIPFEADENRIVLAFDVIPK